MHPNSVKRSEFLIAAGLLTFVTLLGQGINELVGYQSIALLYIVSVAAAALFLGPMTVIVTAIAGVLLWNYVFLPPRFSFLLTSIQDGMTVITLLAVALAMGHLISRLRSSERSANEALEARDLLFAEKEKFREAAQRAEIIEKSDHLRRVLLDNVSHELKTPVAAITAAVSVAREARETLPSSVGNLIDEIGQASARLERSVGLLIDSARIETGVLTPRKDWCDLREIIDDTVESCAAVIQERTFKVDIPEDLPMLKIDSRLTQQALIQILNNAFVHTRNDVELEAQIENGVLRIEVRDRGEGLTDAGLVFEKFYREHPERTRGLGLGLSIARGMMLAQDGTIRAENRSGGGARFTIILPVETRSKENL